MSLISGVLLLGACNTTVKEDKKVVEIVQESTSIAKDIPFTIAERYFSKSNHNTSQTAIIRTSEELNNHLGMAAVMGPNGTPTTIDFDKSFVIMVAEPTTNHNTTIEPVSLVSDENGKITFNYKVIKGEQQSYEIKPVLSIIVPNENTGEVVFNRIES